MFKLAFLLILIINPLHSCFKSFQLIVWKPFTCAILSSFLSQRIDLSTHRPSSGCMLIRVSSGNFELDPFFFYLIYGVKFFSFRWPRLRISRPGQSLGTAQLLLTLFQRSKSTHYPAQGLDAKLLSPNLQTNVLIYLRRLNLKYEFCSIFPDVPEDRNTQRPKHCHHNNKDNISHGTILNDHSFKKIKF